MTALVEPFQKWLNVGLGFFYPEICQLCEAERATARDGFVCARCWSQVRFIRPPFCERCGLPFPGDITRHLNARIAARWNCISVRRARRWSRAASCWRRSTASNTSAQLWFEPFLAGLFMREAAPALARPELGFDRARPAASGETARTRIQPGRTSGRSPERRHCEFR